MLNRGEISGFGGSLALGVPEDSFPGKVGKVRGGVLIAWYAYLLYWNSTLPGE